MGAYRDYTGKTINGVQVIERAPNCKGPVPYWKCICVCGRDLVIRRDHLEKGSFCRVCGSEKSAEYRRKNPPQLKHGMTGTPEYRAWAHMKSRCGNPKNRHFHNYGGRGITVCDEWKCDFEAFLAHVGQRPTDGHSLERIDNALGYQPGNVKWATKAEQQNNRRVNRWMVYNGKTMTIAQAIVASGLPKSAVRNRLHNGWSPERALSEPVRSRG